MRKFNIRDKVRCLVAFEGNKKIKGAEGIVVDTSVSARPGVNFKKDVGGHTCDHRCRYGYGWYVDPSCLHLIARRKR